VANRLAGERSAYLLQHRDNPVDWYPWCDEAFELARRENKPVLVSIGYSSCHWCHVMEHESFEDAETARLMNEKLVCIKVDREERPDVDQIYMETVMRLTGSGGWPLNVFCTPDGRPFYGGTYFPPSAAYGRPSWRDVIQSVTRAYHEQGDQVEEQARRLVEILHLRPDPEPRRVPGRDDLHAFAVDLMRRADTVNGGFGNAPKFPTPTNLEALLLAHALHIATPDALEHVVFTLDRMSRGGIYDQIGGGFHRYSVDERWLVPHFEKMLYDEGQLLRVYAESYRQSRNPELLWPLEETIAFLEREMRSPEGGYFASLDADSEGAEGLYYVWTPAQIVEVLGEEQGEQFCTAYGVHAGGNFERSGSSILTHALAGERSRFTDQRAKLLEARGGRIRPETDTKRITAWLGYTASGLAVSGATLNRPEWVELAADTLDFVLERLVDDEGRLLRVGYDGEGRVAAFLDDHASMLVALLDLHRAGGPERAIDGAIRIAEAIRDRFYDPEERDLFFVPAESRDLIVRPSSDPDGATPSAAGLAVLGLVRLSTLTGRADLREIVDSVLTTWGRTIATAPTHFPTLLRAASLLETGPGVAVVVGDPAAAATRALAARSRELLTPEEAVVVIAPGASPDWIDPDWLRGRDEKAGAPTAYVCRGTSAG
jgi:uncharacterized protein YyaL (SSP411 family)